MLNTSSEIDRYLLHWIGRKINIRSHVISRCICRIARPESGKYLCADRRDVTGIGSAQDRHTAALIRRCVARLDAVMIAAKLTAPRYAQRLRKTHVEVALHVEVGGPLIERH